MGKQPAQSSQTTCPIDRRCHLRGKGLTIFGTAFTPAKVLDIASSSVLLIDHTTNQPMGSGTLIADTVVLCASHTVSITGPVDVLLFFECDPSTAPPGTSDQYPSNDPTRLLNWRTCTRLRTKPQAKMISILEHGSDTDLDYALLDIQWTDLAPDPGADIVEVPRFPIARGPSTRISHEVLGVGHPIWAPQTMADVEPTQATTGVVFNAFGPNINTGQGDSYVYTGMNTAFGMSGGGVFNDSGEIIGVIVGRVPGKGDVFLNLGRAADNARNTRLRDWVREGEVLRPHDPHQIFIFRKV